MKKFAMVLGAAAVAVVAGCKDPDYKRGGVVAVQNAPKSAGEMADGMRPAAPEAKKCTCAPGTRHPVPCACGGENCFCVVEVKSVPTPAPAPAPVVRTPAPVVVAAPEFSVYVVRPGDYLAKISKRFNVTIASIKRLNNMTKDVVRVGQKLKIPGKVDVGEAPAVQAQPVVRPVSVKSDKKAYVPYSGATKEYVVKNGDTLGSIAHASGIGIRQLKELNGLSSDMLRIGQKLKVPASKPEKAAVVKKSDKPAEKPVEKPVAAKNDAAEQPVDGDAASETQGAAEGAAPETQSAVGEPATEDKAAAAAPADAAASAPATTTYVVQEGDDITGIAIRFGVSATVIRELNNLGDNDQLKPGQILKLPAEAQQ